MKRYNRFVMVFLLIFGVVSLLSAGQGTDIPKAQLPILTTSAGQSPDVTTLNIIMEEAGIKFDYCDVPTPDIMKTGTGLGGQESGEGFHAEVYTDMEQFPQGTPYKTIIFAIGASLKGMGASGLTVDSEASRLKSLIDHCKQTGMFIIAIHVGGASKRGAPGSDNEKMIDAVAPFADFIIVTADSNKDGRFSTIAKDNNIPLTQVEYALDVVSILQSVFQ